MLLGTETVLHNVGLEVEPDVGAVYGSADCTSDDDANEDYAELAEVEVVDVDVDEGKGFEE